MNINSVYAKTAIEALRTNHPDDYPDTETARRFVEKYSLEEVEEKCQIKGEVRRNLYSVFLALEAIGHPVPQEEIEKAWEEVLNGNEGGEQSLLEGYGKILKERFDTPGYIDLALREGSHGLWVMQSESRLDMENNPKDVHKYLPMWLLGIDDVLEKYNFLIPMLQAIGIEPSKQGLTQQHLRYQTMALEHFGIISTESLFEFIKNLGENFEPLEFYSEEQKKLYSNPAFIKMVIEQLAERYSIFDFVRAAANPAIRTPHDFEHNGEETHEKPDNEVDTSEVPDNGENQGTIADKEGSPDSYPQLGTMAVEKIRDLKEIFEHNGEETHQETYNEVDTSEIHDGKFTLKEVRDLKEKPNDFRK